MEKLLERVKAGKRLVVVLRGVSGAGKSTLAKKLCAAAPGVSEIVSADAFFTDAEGRYQFDPDKLGAAHGECIKAFVRTLQLDAAYGVKHSLVVVDNTNTTIAECAPYMAVGAAYGWQTLLATLEVDPRMALERNVHGADYRTVHVQSRQMLSAAFAMPDFWEHVAVTP